MAAKAKRSSTERPYPEKKYGPFHGGVGVAVWLNHVQSDDGPRYFRSVTIAPRRFRDTKTGEWKDAGSLRATDLPALILGLQAAHDFMSNTALPGEPAEDVFQDDQPPSENGTPF